MAKKHEDAQRGIICRREDRHHFRMFESLVGNEGFINLTRPAREAYLLMGLASKGKLEFITRKQYEVRMDADRGKYIQLRLQHIKASETAHNRRGDVSSVI